MGPLAHGGSLTWDELLLVVIAYGLLLLVVLTGRTRRTDPVERTIAANRNDAAAGAAPTGGDGVTVVDVSHRYGSAWALSRCDVRIAAGEFVSIIGANGAGKTTLLQLVAGAAVPTSGDVVVGDASLRADPAAVRSRVGVVTHQPLLYPGLSVVENLRFFATMFAIDDPDPRIGAVLAAADVGGLAATPAGQLSHGQRQRVAIARALLHEPRVLLLDEPFSGLDLVAADHLDELLTHLRRTGLTVIMTSHDLARSHRHADRIVVLAGGRVAEDGSAGDLSLDELEARYRGALR